tara:strand:- start:1408 stop:2949 length:1542 start_codon:yes stop_codon:yes gene_type:complete
MASLIVNNVLSSSLDVTYDYQDTVELFAYTVKGSYTIDVSDINIQLNDTTLIAGRTAITDAYARPNITARIGADDYINGRITSYDFDANTLVGKETVSITIEESRRLDDYSSSQFAKYIPNPHALASFSENYTFSRNGATYSSNRDISISYKQMAGDQFLDNARTFLTNYYFANRPSLGYQEDGISENAKIDKNFKGLISETYDILGLSVSLSEKVNSSFIDEPNNVSKQETQSINIDERGYKTKRINFSLKSLREDSQNVLSKAMAQIIDQAKTDNEAEFGTPFSISKTINKHGDEGTLNLSFTTDPKKSQDDTVSYSGVENKAKKFKEYVLTISYTSKGKTNFEKFENSKKSWVKEQSTYPQKIKRLFHPVSDFFEKSRSTSFDKADGKVNENVVFTTDPAYNTTDDGLLKLKKTLSKTHQINRVGKFLDLSNLEEQISFKALKTVGQASVNAEATVSQSMGLYEAKRILESKTEEFKDFVNEDVVHMINDTITISLGRGQARRTMQFLFL